MNLLSGIILTVLVVAGSEAANESVRQPSESEIFGFLTTDLDTLNLLYICDFFKDLTYLCNVTALGDGFIKNHANDTESKLTAEKAGKIARVNVTGQWSDSDGFMKSGYVKVDYLKIVAKCFFRTTYYECFGVPRCDNAGLFTPCGGGEPWRGSYHGSPKGGFKGNVTSEAQMGAPVNILEREVENSSPEVSTPQPIQNTTANVPITSAENKSVDVNSTGSTGHQVFIKHFSNTDNKTGAISEGTVAIIPEQGTVISESHSFLNNSEGEGSLSSFSSSFSSSSSGTVPDLFESFGTNTSIGEEEAASAETPRRRRPFHILASFPSMFQPIQSVFQPNWMGSLSSAESMGDGQNNVAGPRFQGAPLDFTALRSIVSNFQDFITSSILQSFQRPMSSGRLTAFQPMSFSDFPRFQSSQQLSQPGSPVIQPMSPSIVQQPRMRMLSRNMDYGMSPSYGYRRMDAQSHSNIWGEDDDQDAVRLSWK